MGQSKSIDLPDSGAGSPSATVSSRSRRWLWALALGVVALVGWYYRGSRNASGAADAAAPAATGKGRAGGFSAANMVVPVVVATAQRGDLPVYFNGLGTVTAFNTVTVRSRVDGQLVSVAFKEGQFVHEGDLLAQIDSRPFQVQLEQAMGQLAKDQALRKDAEVNFERYKLLFKEGVIPQQQLDTQAALVGQFDGAIASDQSQIDNAKLQLTYSRITAPISGRIGLRLVDAGNIVHASDANGLLVITQLQPISVIFSLPQDQLPDVNAKLRSGVQLVVDAYDRDDTAKIASGKLQTIDNQIDPTTGTYKLKSTFANADNALFPNQFVNVHLLVDIKHNLTIVPASAIQRGPQGSYVYAVAKDAASKDATAKIYPVTIAQTTGNTVGLSAGLNSGDVVVIDGQDKLQDGTKVNPTPSGGANGASGGSASPSPAQNAPQSGKPSKGQAGESRR
ncbi:MAG TPA: MdtA/MuxA family multidrug efflux RND transporter periplasmic adaptor subunit [Candidatus Polarisedimenticolia bacterium]|nr:MdtA/MuxA family multidrug efflux RND transporter periplasmic adaptor subunit [Candidatus Polarisedimenticolia bacterium]